MTDSRRASIVLLYGAGVTAFLVGGLAARGASATLVSPMPSGGVAAGMVAWLVFGAGLLLLLGRLTTPRLVRRLLTIATLAVTAWSTGTMGRGLYVTLAFAFAEAVEEETTTLRVIGTPTGTRDTQALAATSLEHRRTVSVPFDGAAAEEITAFSTCIDLPLERTPSGVTRMRVPDEPLGMDDLETCAAVMSLGR